MERPKEDFTQWCSIRILYLEPSRRTDTW